MPDPWATRRGHETQQAYKTQCQEQNLPCALCGQPIDYTAPRGTPNAFELDHILPKADYPELLFEPTNFQPTHTTCNRSKGKRAQPIPLGPQTTQW